MMVTLVPVLKSFTVFWDRRGLKVMDLVVTFHESRKKRRRESTNEITKLMNQTVEKRRHWKLRKRTTDDHLQG